MSFTKNKIIMTHTEEFAHLIKDEPFKIGKSNLFKTIITLDGESHCDVPSNLAKDIVQILNGAFREGVTKSFSSIQN